MRDPRDLELVSSESEFRLPQNGEFNELNGNSNRDLCFKQRSWTDFYISGPIMDLAKEIPACRATKGGAVHGDQWIVDSLIYGLRR